MTTLHPPLLIQHDYQTAKNLIYKYQDDDQVVWTSEPVLSVEAMQLCIVSLVVRQCNNIKIQDLCRYTWTKMATMNTHSEVKGKWKSVNITSEMEVRVQTACGPYK